MSNKRSNKGLIFTGLGFELVGLTLGALYFGQIIDEKYSWPGYAAIGLLLCSLGSWLFHLLILLKRFDQDESES